MQQGKHQHQGVKAASKDDKSPLFWYDARLLMIEGKGWTDTEDLYDRLPAKAQGHVPKAVTVVLSEPDQAKAFRTSYTILRGKTKMWA